MDLRQLRSLVAVVDHGSFSAAAEALFTVQSNVSAHVAKLEAELDIVLLDRRTRELTPAGAVVMQRGREVLRQLAAINDDLAGLENRIIGDVACGVTPSIGLHVIPPTLATATQNLPEVTISVMEAHSGALVQQLLLGEIDLALTTGASNSELTSSHLFDEDIVAVMATDHALASQANVSLRDLAQTKLLLPLQDNPLYGHIEQAFEGAGLPLHVGLAIGSSALVEALAGAGVGVALIPATAASTGSTASIVKPIAGMAPRAVALATRTTSQPSRAVTAIQLIIEQTARQAALSMPGCHTTAANASEPELDVLSMP